MGLPKVRLAILADIHANLPALEAVLADLDQLDLQGMLVAGDTTGGPQAGEVLHRLRSLGACTIRGNGEEYLLDYHWGRAPATWYSEPLWASLRWAYAQLDEETLAYLAGLPDQLVVRLDGADPIRMVHGTPWSTRKFLYPDRDPVALDVYGKAGLLPEDMHVPRLVEVLDGLQEQVLICAHSHIPWIQANGRLLVVNPGSVGAPNNGDPRAQYALMTWDGHHWRAELRGVSYDLDLVGEVYRDTGLLAEGGVMAGAFLLGMVSGQNIPGRFVASVRRLAAEAGCRPDDPVPDSVWRAAVTAFDWGEGRDVIMHQLEPH